MKPGCPGLELGESVDVIGVEHENETVYESVCAAEVTFKEEFQKDGRVLEFIEVSLEF